MTRTYKVVRGQMLILADFLLSFHYIYIDHTIFYIEEKVSQQAAACGNSNNDFKPASES